MMLRLLKTTPFLLKRRRYFCRFDWQQHSAASFNMHKSEKQRSGEGGETMRLLSLLDDEKEEEIKGEKTREKKLYEAAMSGSIATLLEFVHEDLSSASDTPLHIAALLGRSDLAKEILDRKPQLAKALNSHGSSPLHVACAKGCVEIVKELLTFNPDACFVLDSDGRSPLHLAAIKGRAKVLTELVRVKPEATLVLTGRGETGLHLCVKYNHLDALKVLVESVDRADGIMNWKDDDGSTVLHLAVAKKQIEVTKFLLSSTGIEVNAQNANGITALDVLYQSPRDLRDRDIRESLQCAGASRMKNSPSIRSDSNIVAVFPTTQLSKMEKIISSKEPVVKHKHIDWLGRKRSALMVVASLIATVAFELGITPPGGVWQDDSDGHQAGRSVMADSRPTEYGQFMIINTISFLASLSIILLLISGLPLRRRRWMWTLMVVTWIAITTQTGTYFIALKQMVPDFAEDTYKNVTLYSVLIWVCLVGLVFVGNVIRMVLWLLRKYGFLEEEPGPAPNFIDDDENENENENDNDDL